jgi:hypothetical protein
VRCWRWNVTARGTTGTIKHILELKSEKTEYISTASDTTSGLAAALRLELNFDNILVTRGWYKYWARTEKTKGKHSQFYEERRRMGWFAVTCI